MVISIAVSGQDFMEFKDQWENAKIVNTEEKDKQWLSLI